MDDEEENYFLNELLGQPDQQPSSIRNLSPENKSHQQTTIPKAYNPIEQLQKYPESKRDAYYQLFMNSKILPGLKGVFDLGEEEQFPQFLANIGDGILEQDDEKEEMMEDGQVRGEQREYIRQEVDKLKIRCGLVEKKIFGSIGLNKTIGTAFYNHFDNFTYLKSEMSFIKSLEISLMKMIEQAKLIKGPGLDLISLIYDYWMKIFKDFVLEIWKHSEKYTLSFLKKVKDQDHENKSSTSSKLKEEKRKPWKVSEIQLLQKIINSGVAFSQNTLNELSMEMGRSTASISSKIQKLIKEKKQQIPQYVHDTASLTDKVLEVLKNYPEGIPRETVIERMKEYYEMGFDGNWEKSVSQILSSRKQIIKVKGTFALKGEHKFDISKKAFKDKVVNCFLRCEERRADMKTLVEIYTKIYGEMEGIGILTEERKKTIEASISKALSRYDIFDKSSSKTVYKLSLIGEEGMDIESYFL